MAVLVRGRTLAGGDETILPRSSCGVSVVGRRLLIIAGEHLARTPLSLAIQTLDLDAASPTWKELAATGPLPPPRLAHAQAVWKDRYVVIFGGRQGITMDEKPLADLQVLDVAAGAWLALSTTGPGPCARSFHQMVISPGGQLYVFGGCGAEGRLSDLWMLDLSCQEKWTGAGGDLVWEQLPSSVAVAGRGGACFFLVDERLYVAAGFANREMSDVHCFDLSSKTWSKEQEGLFSPRSVCPHTVVAHPQTGQPHLLIFGGELEPSARGHEGAGHFGNDVLALPLQADGRVDPPQLWPFMEATAVPQARGWTQLARSGPSTVVLFGGLTGSDADPVRLNDAHELEMVTA